MTKTVFSMALLIAALSVSTATADVTYQLTSDHCTGNCLNATHPSAGTITVANISGGVTITVVLNSGFKFNSGGFDADFGFNLVGNPTIAGSASPNDFNLVSTTAGSLHMDGTGFFEYGFNGTFPNGGGNAVPGPYTFTVTGAGVSTSSFEQNASGQFFALDVASTVNGPAPDGGPKTGAVDASEVCTSCGQSTVPEPTSIGLLGSVLFVVGRTIRKRWIV